MFTGLSHEELRTITVVVIAVLILSSLLTIASYVWHEKIWVAIKQAMALCVIAALFIGLVALARRIDPDAFEILKTPAQPASSPAPTPSPQSRPAPPAPPRTRTYALPIASPTPSTTPTPQESATPQPSCPMSSPSPLFKTEVPTPSPTPLPVKLPGDVKKFEEDEGNDDKPVSVDCQS